MNIQQIESQLKAMADPNRLQIISLLKEKEICVCELVSALQISQPAVSQQLRKLREANIITVRKVGTWKHCTLSTELSPIVQSVVDEIDAAILPPNSKGDFIC